VEFAFDVYQSFHAYTGNHPDITLSGGISLSGPKYPLYQSADDSGKAEGEAKAQGRDRLTLFGQTFQWGEWLGAENTSVSEIEAIRACVRKYIERDPKSNPTLPLFGVFPFVAQLQPLLSTNFPQSFVRNLLSTAQVQEQLLKQAKQINKPATHQEEENEEVKAIRYFLHLPKIAYTLARLPNTIQAAKGFEDIRKSLKSSYNAPYFRAIATWLDLLNRGWS
jgi:CRISPR-associated protein Csm1